MKPEQKISEVALKIFVKYGYHATTIQQIASEAGVSKSAIHYYFRNKKGIYKNVLSNLLPLLRKNTTSCLDYLLFIINELNNNSILFIETIENLNYDRMQIKAFFNLYTTYSIIPHILEKLDKTTSCKTP